MIGPADLTALIALLRHSPAVTGQAASASAPLSLPTAEAAWEDFIQLAVAQKVGPLTAATLLAQPPAVLPPSVAARLRALQTRGTQRALLQYAELLRVQAHLRTEGIPLLFFKGQLLAQQAYGNLGLRTCFDLDLFVHQADVLRVKPLLAALGYRPEFTFRPHEEAGLLRSECEYTFIREDGAARIDLQWQPRARYFSFGVPAQALWDRSVNVSLNGFTVATFAMDDLVLYLIAHGAKHTWHRLEQVCALAGVIHRHPGLNWSAIEAAARAAGADRMLLVAVRLVTEHFQAPVPEALVKRAAQDPRTCALAEEFTQQWTSTPLPLPLFATLRQHLRLRERWRDRIRHCFWLMVTPTSEDWLARPLPPHLHWAHYLFRPGRLLGKYARVKQGSA